MAVTHLLRLAEKGLHSILSTRRINLDNYNNDSNE